MINPLCHTRRNQNEENEGPMIDEAMCKVVVVDVVEVGEPIMSR
jgi:hypothetical protein